jgi:4-nitrophenyl phosphatase
MGDSERLAATKCFLLDMDGTFYLGDRLLPGALEFVTLLAKRQLPFLFLTNNSSRSRSNYVHKLAKLGLTVREDKIFTSGEATTIFLKREAPGAEVFVVGTPSLEEEFRANGFELVHENPDYVVLGFDTTFDYAKLWRLCEMVRAGVGYIATHPDLNCPTENGVMPDIGCVIEFVATSTGRRPDVVVGKPNHPIVDALVAKTGFSASEMTMVGDRLYTDIALGQHGLRTVLVLSGESTRDDLAASDFQPDHVMQDLAQLVGALGEGRDT